VSAAAETGAAPPAALATALPAQPVARRPGVLSRLLRDPAGAISLTAVALILLAALLAPLLAPGDPYDNDLARALQPPGAPGLPLGADAQGRDMITRLLYGLRVSLLMSLVATATGGALGALLGFLAAFYERSLDAVIMRLMDMLLSFPAILVGLALAAIMGPGLFPVVLALAIATVPLMARIVRGSALVVTRLDYVAAARTLGTSDGNLIWRHVAPNCLSPILVFVTLRFGQVILLGSALSFLGMGAQPPTAELGAMASEGRNFLFFAPHIAVVPCVAIFAIVLAFNLLGDALRDALDPRISL
jgi:ABC-type dipeptide/oligopeptide/nickel transport system permease subunit